MSVEVARTDRLLTVTWDRPPLNVLDMVLLRELDEILKRCAADPTIDVVVLQGQGQKAFSAGVDIKDHTKDKVPEMLDVVHGVIRRLLSLPQVTIAVVRGAGFVAVAKSPVYAILSSLRRKVLSRPRKFMLVVTRRWRWRALRH